MYSAFLLLNAVPCFLVAYGMFGLKRWAPLVVMLTNGLYLALLASLSWNTIRAGRYPSSLGEATVDAIAVGFLVGVIALSLWANRRSLLNN